MVDVSDIMTRLEAIADELGEMTMNILTQAIQDGQTSRPQQEKSLSQARRSVEKALQQLGKSSPSSD
jgi:ElaB/YqjD/DUF883 family membrane-anchored ribosome-binding protein